MINILEQIWYTGVITVLAAGVATIVVFLWRESRVVANLDDERVLRSADTNIL